MGYLKYIRDIWKKPKTNPLYRERLIKWRQEPVTLRIDHPTRIDRARSLGYKAKQGYIIVRQKLLRGGRQRPMITGGGRKEKEKKKKKSIKQAISADCRRKSSKEIP